MMVVKEGQFLIFATVIYEKIFVSTIKSFTLPVDFGFSGMLKAKSKTTAVSTAVFYFHNVCGHKNCIIFTQILFMEVCFKFDQNNPTIPEEIAKTLVLILNNQNKIMAAIDELKGQVANLQERMSEFQTALDNEQAQVAALLETNAQVVVDLNNQITALNAQIAAGATPEQIQEVVASLTTIRESLATTKADLEGTVPDAAPQG